MKSGTQNDSAQRRLKHTVSDESHLTSEPLPCGLGCVGDPAQGGWHGQLLQRMGVLP